MIQHATASLPGPTRLPASPFFAGARPHLSDWSNMLGSLWPEVRLKKFLEMRGADGGPWRMLASLPALWVGLLYDRKAQQQALSLIADWSQVSSCSLSAVSCSDYYV